MRLSELFSDDIAGCKAGYWVDPGGVEAAEWLHDEVARAHARVGQRKLGGVDDEAVDGNQVDMIVKAGQQVLVGKYSGSKVKLNDEEYTIVRQSDILAVIE